MHLFYRILHFFIDNFPSTRLIMWLFPVITAWSFMSLLLAGIFKKKWQWKTGYTRKLFHFLIFITAYFIQLIYGLPGVFILGWGVTAAVFFCCYKGEGNIFYEALAREKDAPFRTKYIIYSYLATFIGGVLANLLFGQFAIFGYAITGIADAIAEPVGTRYGRHFYKVFSFDKSKLSTRSIEGSIAVFLSSVLFSSLIIYSTAIFTISFPVLLLIGVICTIVEGISPSGFDNAILQLTASFLFSALIRYQ